MKFRLRFLATIAAIMSCMTLLAQPMSLTETSESDVQARFRAALEIPLGNKWDFNWSEQLRLHNNFGNIDKIVSTVGVGYEPWQFLKVGADYSFVNERNTKTDNNTGVKSAEWGIRHRVNIDVTGTLRMGRVKLSLRERLRVQFRGDSINKYEHPNPALSLRTRLKGSVKLRNPHWEPYAFVELYHTLNSPAPVKNFKEEPLAYKNYVPRLRLAVGTEYKIDNHHRMEFYYMVHFNKSYDARYKANSGDIKEWSLEKVCAHVIGIDYKFKL